MMRYSSEFGLKRRPPPCGVCIVGFRRIRLFAGLGQIDAASDGLPGQHVVIEFGIVSAKT